MYNKKLVSIIIPIYNRAHIVHDTMASIVNQSYTNWECIIVDDGSTDNTEQVVLDYIKNDDRFKFYKRPKIHLSGSNGARNYGFILAKGEYINWMDSDDILHPTFIQTKIDAFIQNSNLQVVITKSILTKPDTTEIIGTENRTRPSKNLLEDFITNKASWYVGDPMWKKDFLKGKNLFDEHLLNGHDRDFHIRMLTYKPNIEFIDKGLYFYRIFGNTTSNVFDVKTCISILNSASTRNQLLVKHGISNETKLFILKQMFKLYKYVHKEKNILNYFKIQNNILKSNTLNYYMLIFKFTLSIVSFKLFNKGEKFLN